MMGNTVQKGLWLDPRAKLFLILMCVLCSMFAPSLSSQFALVLLIDGLDHGGHDGDATDHVCCVPWTVP